MEPQGSPCPYPDEPEKYTPSYPTSWRSTFIIYHLSLRLPSSLFPSGFPANTMYALVTHTCHIPRPSLFTVSSEQYLVTSTNYENYAHFSSLLLTSLSPSIFHSTPFSISSTCSSLNVRSSFTTTRSSFTWTFLRAYSKAKLQSNHMKHFSGQCE